MTDLSAEMAASRLSISQCGYNTALDIVRAGVPALVVPFADGGETEQTDRARRLEALGALRVLPAEPPERDDPGRCHRGDAGVRAGTARARSGRRERNGAAGTGAGPRLTTCRPSAHVGSMTRLARSRPAGARVRLSARHVLLSRRRCRLGRRRVVPASRRRDVVPSAARAGRDSDGNRPAPRGGPAIARDFRRLDDLGASAWLRARQSRAGRPQIRVRSRRGRATCSARTSQTAGNSCRTRWDSRCRRSSRRPGTGAPATPLNAWWSSATRSCRETSRPTRSGLAPLHELPVCLDWTGRRGARLGAARWGETIAGAIGPGATVGFMLHHAAMSAGDRRMLSELLEVLAGYPHPVRQMLDIATASRAS